MDRKLVAVAEGTGLQGQVGDGPGGWQGVVAP